MSDYRRWRIEGGTYFFTIVTHQRRPILTTEFGRASLRRAIQDVRIRWPFRIFAIVLLPDHLHAILELPVGDDDYRVRWQKIKEGFTRRFLAVGGEESERSTSREQRQERGVWQRRYWEHTIREEDDLRRCADYLHWNPVKHELVSRVVDWPWSSFHRFVSLGEYDSNWGGVNPVPIGDFGE